MGRGGQFIMLVDAHNVMHHDPLLHKQMADPEQARAALEHILSDQPRMILFYDGGPGGVVHGTRRQGLQIDYSGTGEADDRIVRWLQHHPDQRAMVVSDDAALRRRVRLLGAAHANARGFLERFRVSNDPRTEQGPLSAAEVEAWMREFGVQDEE